jgi:hypothetical protein
MSGNGHSSLNLAVIVTHAIKVVKAGIMPTLILTLRAWTERGAPWLHQAITRLAPPLNEAAGIQSWGVFPYTCSRTQAQCHIL